MVPVAVVTAIIVKLFAVVARNLIKVVIYNTDVTAMCSMTKNVESYA